MFECSAKEAFRAARHKNVDHVPVRINSPPQVTALTSNIDKELIDVPDIAQSALLSPWRSSVAGPELATPPPNRLVKDDDASFSE
jgi:hypothetical protein